MVNLTHTLVAELHVLIETAQVIDPKLSTMIGTQIRISVAMYSCNGKISKNICRQSTMNRLSIVLHPVAIAEAPEDTSDSVILFSINAMHTPIY
jgi:hypothetical protein